jgi:hypothetical protein
VFLGDGTSETLLCMLLALATEVSALADEVDDLRQELAVLRGAAAAPPEEIERQRTARRRGTIDRLLRIVQEELGSPANERRNAAYREFVERLSC